MFAGTGCCGGSSTPCQSNPTYSACVDDNGIHNTTSTASLFENLSVEDIESAVTFLLAQGDLNLTAYEDATIDSNYIFLLETLVPPKQDVLNYLDNSGANPGRWARAILYNGGKATPDVTEVKVGPLPVSGSTIVEQINNLGEIPFSSRSPDDVEYTLIDEFVVSVCEEIDQLMLESFGAHYFNCTDDCLEWSDSAPRGPGRDKRNIWLWFEYLTDGKYMHHTGLEMKINHFGTDVSQWKLEKIVYNGVGFNSTAELLNAYNTGGVEKITPTTADNLAHSSFARKSNSRARGGVGENKKPPRHYEPEGKRFSIAGSHVEYMGWDLDVNIRASAGLGLWNVKFLGERIAYELSLQDASASYSSIQPCQSLSTYLDAAWGMGSSSYELKAGVDCPAHAAFLDVTQYIGGAPTIFKNALCIFEQDLSIPIARHVSNLESFDSYVGAGSYALVVRTISTVYNYDYVYDYIFYLNGVIEVKVSTSGYFQGTWWNPADAAYTTRATEKTGGSLHDHLVNYKVDLDIAGTGNSFIKRNIVTEVINLPWHDWPHHQKKLVDHILQNETEGGIVYDFNHPAVYSVINPSAQNNVGNHRGYRIAIKDNAKDLLQDAPLHKGLQWAKYQIAVTKHKDTEPHSSVMYNQAVLAEPVLEFDSFLDGDNLVNEDIVTWITIGVFHMVHAEDIPMTHTPGNYASFFLKPNNFFDFDPSIDLKHAVIIKAGASGDAAGNVYEYDGTTNTAQCAPKTTVPAFDGYQH